MGFGFKDCAYLALSISPRVRCAARDLAGRAQFKPVEKGHFDGGPGILNLVNTKLPAWVGRPLRLLGLSVGVIQAEMEPEEKRAAYACDVTYVTNQQLGFDYLRDQMACRPSDLRLRSEEPFSCAIVDEADSVLIDEGRTPLVVSTQSTIPSEKYTTALQVASQLAKLTDYTVLEKEKTCVLTEVGELKVSAALGKDDLFDPQDPWAPFIVNSLTAKELYQRDRQYLVRDGQVVVVDEFTGRPVEGRSWSDGLQQAIEAKEGVEIQPEAVVLASISYQCLFRLFKKLSGMTGTASTEAQELESIYSLTVSPVPSNKPCQRLDEEDEVLGLCRAMLDMNSELALPELVPGSRRQAFFGEFEYETEIPSVARTAARMYNYEQPVALLGYSSQYLDDLAEEHLAYWSDQELDLNDEDACDCAADIIQTEEEAYMAYMATQARVQKGHAALRPPPSELSGSFSIDQKRARLMALKVANNRGPAMTFEDMQIYSVTDASHANDYETGEGTTYIVGYHSSVIRRDGRLVKAMDHKNIHMMTDCRSLEEQLHQVLDMMATGDLKVDMDKVYTTEGGKWRAVTAAACEAHSLGRPVLVGTTSVEPHPAFILTPYRN
ncbi:Protein translocase subunit SecA [Symbiodinium microadriaticum]|uniref:Protein translocase subunit SecA n=1 Tax=Symbiodinium microadriaticum TaxID=2951 RepID=A0A1Q9E8C3_SYMMI|nr:Protein translocase subunit SecA [Symbiodinium microadriaticum]